MRGVRGHFFAARVEDPGEISDEARTADEDERSPLPGKDAESPCRAGRRWRRRSGRTGLRSIGDERSGLAPGAPAERPSSARASSTDRSAGPAARPTGARRAPRARPSGPPERIRRSRRNGRASRPPAFGGSVDRGDRPWVRSCVFLLDRDAVRLYGCPSEPSRGGQRENATDRGVPWQGCGTALVTPFDDKGRIDFGALEALVDWQIAEGVDFLLPCGTTGESATLSREERQAVTAAVVRAANGRVPVSPGRAAITRRERSSGRATRRRPRRTAFSRSRRCTTGRAPKASCVTSRRSPTRRTCRSSSATSPAARRSISTSKRSSRLAEIPRVAGLKEASTDFGKIARLMASVPEDFAVFAGQDATALALIALGARGVISVVSNEIPKRDVDPRARRTRRPARRGAGAPAPVSAADGDELSSSRTRDRSSARCRS